MNSRRRPCHAFGRKIGGMSCGSNSRCIRAAAIPLLILSAAIALAANGRPVSSEKSTPQLSVRVYSFLRLSRWLLRSAELEAHRLLIDVPIEFDWVDCTSPSLSSACTSDSTSKDLVVRVLAKALPQASADALGIAGSKGDDAVAFLFYDRMLVLRTHEKPLPLIVGRVLAHEITHLLLLENAHSDRGLMRAKWSADDMRPESSACLGLSLASVQRMHQEALRRESARQPRVEMIARTSRDRRSQ